MWICELEELPTRAYTALRRANVKTVEELCAMSAPEILRIEGIGKLCFWEIAKTLLKSGFPAPKMDRYGKPVKYIIRVPMGRAVA